MLKALTEVVPVIMAVMIQLLLQARQHFQTFRLDLCLRASTRSRISNCSTPAATQYQESIAPFVSRSGRVN